MADLQAGARSALAGIAVADREAQPPGTAGVVLRERQGLDCLILLARNGQVDALRAKLQSMGYDLPATPRRTEGPGLALIWTGPNQWLALSEPRHAVQTRNLLTPLAGLCSTVQAEDARVVVEVSGPRARDTLAKLLALDLHPRVFKPGDAAVTATGGSIPAYLWQMDAAPTFEIAVPRSFARSFWHGLTDAAAEYGCTVRDAR